MAKHLTIKARIFQRYKKPAHAACSRDPHNAVSHDAPNMAGIQANLVTYAVASSQPGRQKLPNPQAAPTNEPMPLLPARSLLCHCTATATRPHQPGLAQAGHAAPGGDLAAAFLFCTPALASSLRMMASSSVQTSCMGGRCPGTASQHRWISLTTCHTAPQDSRCSLQGSAGQGMVKLLSVFPCSAVF